MGLELSSNQIPNLDEIRLARLIEPSPKPENLLDIYPVSRQNIIVRHAGMAIRAVVTEPLDTTEHTERPAIIIKHGFMASRPAYSSYAAALASNGNRVVHYGMPRTSTYGRSYHPKNITDILRQHSQALNGVSNALREIHPSDNDIYSYIGHSMGGLAVSKYIAYRPEKVDAAVLLGSAGLAPHTFKQMALRGLMAVKEEIVPFVREAPTDTRKDLAVHSLWHIARNPLMVLREGHQAAVGDARQNIAVARDAGVRVGALWMSHDTFFPIHEIDNSIKNQFDATMTTWGDHLKPQAFPRQAAADALTLLAQLRQDNLVETADFRNSTA